MIILKTKNQIDKIRKSCNVIDSVFKELKSIINPGITTLELNTIVETMCLDLGGSPGLKGYHNFPFSACFSKNEVVVHGLPDSIPLVDGDLLSIDLGVCIDGWWGDSATTLPVGNISDEGLRLILAGQKALFEGLLAVHPYCSLKSISGAIKSVSEETLTSVIKELCGHGIGRDLHELPNVSNYESDNLILKPGTIFTIEPIICGGKGKIQTLADGWTTITSDKSLAVQFECTVAIFEDRVELLTKEFL